MKSEDELKQLYGQYIFRFASMKEEYHPDKDGITERDIANQLLGAAFAYGRMLGLGMSRIRLDAKRAISMAEEKEFVQKNYTKLSSLL